MDEKSLILFALNMVVFVCSLIGYGWLCKTCSTGLVSV